MLHRVRALLVIASLGGLMAACAPPSGEPTSAPTSAVAPTEAAQSATYPVQVDGKVPDITAAYLAYFPTEVKAHPGDTIQFTHVDTGEPHTITFGTLANAAAEQFQTLGPQAGEQTPAAMALPPFGPSPTSLEVYQSATQPCFMDSGTVPQTACPQVTQPDFNGQQEFYNSGWIAPEAVWSVKLADDLAPGTYRYLCLIHRGAMLGTVTVVAKDATVPNADADKQAGDAELEALAAKMKPNIDTAVSAATAAQPVAGVLAQDIQNVEGNVFAPKPITITAGSSITWPVWGPHSISFNAPESANQVRTVTSNGDVIVNPEAVDPVGGAGQPTPPPTTPGPPPTTTGPTPDPNGPPPPPTVIDGGSWNGQGEHSSGTLLSFPPELYAYKLTFTTPGTYTYKCLVHPDMEGTVKVQ